MSPEVHFQRMGYQPMRTSAAAADWFSAHVKSFATEPVKAETASSGDLGYTWGRFNVTPSDRAAYTGHYVRVWTRKADGAWQLVAEVTTPPPSQSPVVSLWTVDCGLWTVDCGLTSH
jgi:ketosteroid isomerase-like protein